MDIILVSDKLAKARTFSVSVPQLGLAAAALILAVMVATSAFNYALLKYGTQNRLPLVQQLFGDVYAAQDQAKGDSYVRESLNAMAVRVGQMQAQLLRLDTLGERLAKLAGFRPQELMFGETPGQGGAPSSIPNRDISLGEFSQQLDALTRHLDDRGDTLGVLESLLSDEGVRRKLVPTVVPVEAGWHSSNYGWRIDPFSGQRAFHEGIDFLAQHGTAIHAAAGGVVVYSDFHPQYGNMVEIDHGNDLVSRYAHAHRRLVKAGDVVLSGAKIAEVGRTGRATGPHLHFEVRHRGVPQNPKQFLRLPG